VVNAPVAEEAVRALALGSSRADVLAQLGEPKFRLSSGVDRWTYPLTNNGSAKLEFHGGKLADVQIIPAP
jgi:outer membrane protein assembly factor BamE (lipoprotein component of BamABCDE complex)